jgi:hypothetical protein
MLQQGNHGKKAYKWLVATLAVTRSVAPAMEGSGDATSKKVNLSETFRKPLNKLSSQQTMLLGG